MSSIVGIITIIISTGGLTTMLLILHNEKRNAQERMEEIKNSTYTYIFIKFKKVISILLDCIVYVLFFKVFFLNII